MRRFLLPLGAFALIVLVLAIGIYHSPQKGIIPSPLIGKPAPQFSVPNLSERDKPVGSATLQGRWYVFNVWGTWCNECRAEHEQLLAVKRSNVVPIIGLDWKDEDATALEWLAQLGNPYDAVGVDRDGRVAIDWGVYGAPETFLVDPRGTVVHKHVGALTAQVWARDFLPHLPRATAAP
ncbi:MAG TPA: DsbE family thiol:disulfide interchange protein [Steroidobacteraceae bacterium]